MGVGSGGTAGECRWRAVSPDGVRHDIRNKRKWFECLQRGPIRRPPVGDLRWRPPLPAAPWTGTHKADAFAPACMQVGVSMPGETPPTVSEDCLYLKIWTPAKTAHAQLPVIVWIYGGGYINGSAAMPLYWGDQLAHKGVIVVTVAYRLGPLGFLALPELTRESPHHSSGNYGLMDQIAALEWIQRNIAAFGGDPKCVTIAGQSSGSMSVSILMASPLARGLFQRNTRVHFIQPLKERIVREVGYGLSLEGASAADLVKSMQAKSEPVARKGKPREAP